MMAAAHATHKTILKKRSGFLGAARGRYLPCGAFVMQCNGQTQTDTPRIGFTVTKKIGNAPVRNRIRRRLREAVRHTGDEFFMPCHDYVLVGRHGALSIEFAALCAEIETALKKLAEGGGRPARSGPRRSKR